MKSTKFQCLYQQGPMNVYTVLYKLGINKAPQRTCEKQKHHKKGDPNQHQSSTKQSLFCTPIVKANYQNKRGEN